LADDLRRGALSMVLSALLFAGMGVTVKLASEALPNAQVVFFRNVLGLAFLLPLLGARGLRDLRSAHLGGHLVRGLAGLSSMYCYFFAIAHLGLAEAILLNYSMPLFIPAVEAAWLKERLPRGLLRSLGVGLVGVALILRPGPGLLRPAALVGLASALFGALAQVGVRRLTHSEPTTRIVFYFAAIGTVASAAPAAAAWRPVPSRLFPALPVMGACATAGQLFLTRAYAHAPAARVGPFIYASVGFAALLDYLFWGRLLDAFSLAGAALVILAGVLALRLGPAPVPAS
jgi:drug/metabolite transporter (DMT)-like permease